MRTDTRLPAGAVYRPRNPRASPLYQCVRRHGAELDAARLVDRPVETEVLERFLARCALRSKGSLRTGPEVRS